MSQYTVRVHACVLTTNLPNLFTHEGENPKVKHKFQSGRAVGVRGLEVHQQNIGKQVEEQEVHQHVAKK